MDLEELKLFLKIDYDEEDTFIQGLQLSAEEYLTNAGIKKDYTKELYKLAIKILVSHWYENRSVETIGKNVSKIAFGLDTILVQLKYSQGDAI
ncbi:head-tail connector protein [Clostridium tertium]|uniref:Head-tail connector protein n=1 Tax=Clostridium tertium TaxID=1559 RepID=A0A9X3XPB8_9CLOT|nr:head-tail connector protein [Clostridium tertium]MDC4242476.1 head-tail connector protein [Clostridium tertium]